MLGYAQEKSLETIKKHGYEIAVVLLPGIQYYTGQFFRMETITKAAQEQGCIVGQAFLEKVLTESSRKKKRSVGFTIFLPFSHFWRG